MTCATTEREFAECGLSSLGRAEAHVLATSDAVLARLGEPPAQVDEALVEPRQGIEPWTFSLRVRSEPY